jgi:hypothetical protein
MATVTQIVLTDSLDERIKSDVETVTFYHPVTGQKLEIELGEQNRKHFTNHLEKLDKYFDAARVVEDEKPVKKAPKADGELAKIRKWAQENGYAVGDRGRIKAEIVEAYHAAQKPVSAAVADPSDGCTIAPLTDDEVIATVPLVPVVDETVPATLESALENSAAGNVTDLGDFTQYAGDGPDDAEILAMMAEIEAENGNVELEDLQAKLDNE